MQGREQLQRLVIDRIEALQLSKVSCHLQLRSPGANEVRNGIHGTKSGRGWVVGERVADTKVLARSR